MDIIGDIRNERWELLPHHATRAKQHNESIVRIEALVRKLIQMNISDAVDAFNRGRNAGLELRERIDKVVSETPSTWREEVEDADRYRELFDTISTKDLRIIELEAQINTYKLAADPCDLCRHDGKKASQMPCNICAMAGGDFVKWEPKTMEDAE